MLESLRAVFNVIFGEPEKNLPQAPITRPKDAVQLVFTSCLLDIVLFRFAFKLAPPTTADQTVFGLTCAAFYFCFGLLFLTSARWRNGRSPFAALGLYFAGLIAGSFICVAFYVCLFPKLTKSHPYQFALLTLITGSRAGPEIFVYAGVNPSRYLRSPDLRATCALLCIFVPYLVALYISPAVARILCILDEENWYSSPVGACSIASSFTPTIARLLMLGVCYYAICRQKHHARKQARRRMAEDNNRADSVEHK